MRVRNGLRGRGKRRGPIDQYSRVNKACHYPLEKGGSSICTRKKSKTGHHKIEMGKGKGTISSSSTSGNGDARLPDLKKKEDIEVAKKLCKAGDDWLRKGSKIQLGVSLGKERRVPDNGGVLCCFRRKPLRRRKK